MIQKAHVFAFLAIVCMVMGTGLPAHSEEIKTYEALYAALPGQGKVDHSKEIDSALKSVVKLQALRENRLVTIDGPQDIKVYNPKFLSISFRASVKEKLASARAKPTPAIFALLFEKDSGNELTYKSIFLDWIGSSDVEKYADVTLEKMSEFYRSKGAEYVYVESKKQEIDVKNLALDGANIQSGVISERFIDDAITRDSELQQILDKRIQNVADKINHSKPDENAGDSLRIQQLEARIQKLETMLMNVTRKGNDLVFSNMNIFIQNGTGKENRTNGTGNLVVGYDDPGKGSHNIMVGSENKCSSYGSIVTGHGNVVDGKCGAILGGENNDAGGQYAVILGGKGNKASGDYSSVLGGSDNNAKGEYSSINGQHGRTKVDRDENKHFQSN